MTALETYIARMNADAILWNRKSVTMPLSDDDIERVLEKILIDLQLPNPAVCSREVDMEVRQLAAYDACLELSANTLQSLLKTI
jgi:hypothetical protein